MTRPTVVFLGTPACHERVAEVLGERYQTRAPALTQAEVSAALVDATGLLDGALRLRLDSELLSRGRLLRIVVTASTGSDHVDRDCLLERGIAFASLRQERQLLERITATPEHAWGLLLACMRHIPRAHADVLQGHWARLSFQGRMLSGRTLGLIGLGRVGRALARYGHAFGMRVVACEPMPERVPPDVELMSLNRLAAESDVISVQTHLEESTRHIVSAAFLASVKPGAVLVNVARGALVDSSALISALEAGRLSAAGLDVLPEEPDIANSPLLAYARSHPNLIITPHIGGACEDALLLACTRAAELLRASLEQG